MRNNPWEIEVCVFQRPEKGKPPHSPQKKKIKVYKLKIKTIYKLFIHFVFIFNNNSLSRITRRINKIIKIKKKCRKYSSYRLYEILTTKKKFHPLIFFLFLIFFFNHTLLNEEKIHKPYMYVFFF